MLHKLFDSNNNVLWLIFSGMIFIIGLAAAYFVPIFVLLFRSVPATEVGYNPSEVMIWYAYGSFAMFAVALYLIYKFKKLSSRIVGGFVGVVLCVLCAYFSLNSYTYVDENYIEFGKGYTQARYEWTDVKELYYNRNLDSHWFEIVTNDGERYEVVFGGLLHTGVENHIRRTLDAIGIKMIDIS